MSVDGMFDFSTASFTPLYHIFVDRVKKNVYTIVHPSFLFHFISFRCVYDTGERDRSERSTKTKHEGHLVMVRELALQTNATEFDSYWVSHILT